MTSLGRVPFRVGKPTITCHYLIASRIQVACPDCGMRCFVALDSRLLDPRKVRPKPDEPKAREAQLHEPHCPVASLRRRR